MRPLAPVQVVPHWNARWKFLLEDQDVRRWHENVARGSHVTTEVYLRLLGRFMDACGVTPREYADLEAKTRDDLLADAVTHQLRLGRAASYVAGTKKAAASWLAWNGKKLERPVKIPGMSSTPTLDNAQIPTQQQLRAVLDVADSRARLAILVVAQAGQRLEVLGDHKGKNGLQLRHLPKLEVNEKGVVLHRVPAILQVPAHLSKTRRAYFSFLGPEACECLIGHMRERLQDGERLDASSPLITPRRGYDGPFMTTKSVSCIIRHPMQAAGLREPPYIWHSYFGSQGMVAERRGFHRDYKEFFMGHTGDIAHVYALHKKIPTATVEAMRKACECGLEDLETRFAGIGKNPVLDMIGVVLQGNGHSAEDVAALKLEDCSTEDLVALLKKGTKTALAAVAIARQEQRIASLSELDSLMEHGWRFTANLGDGRAVVSRGTPSA